MFSILDRYIGKTILTMIGLTLFLLVSLSTIIRFIDQLRRIKVDYDVIAAAYYSVLLSPKDLEIFFPIAALLGSLIGLGALASKSELVVMETSGFSRFRIAKAVMKTSIPIVLLTMAIGEWVSPDAEQTARNMRSEKIYGSSLLATQNSVWAKDGDNYVHINQINNDGSIGNIEIYMVKDNKMTSFYHARYGSYKDQAWQLNQVSEYDFTDKDQIKNNMMINWRWQTSITPDKLTVVAQNPESLSAIGLYQYAKYLHASGQDASNYQLLFWKKIFKPLSVAVMMLLALSFIFGPLRSVSMGIRIVSGIACGFIFYIADSLFGQIAIVSGIAPVLGACLTSALFLVISIYLLSKKL